MFLFIDNVWNLYLKFRCGTHTAISSLLLLIVLPNAAADVPRCEVCRADCDYVTIQDAIDAAADGDVIDVCDGIYQESINFLGKAITVRSMNGPENTTIENPESRTSSCIVFNNGEGPDSVLHGFSISGHDTAWSQLGGGINITDSSPTLTGNIIENNEAIDYGGGLYCEGSEATFESAPRPVIRNNIFRWNLVTRGDGGGIALKNCSPSISDSIFEHNTSRNGEGGGIHWEGTSTPVLENVVIANNTAPNGSGGGIDILGSSGGVIRDSQINNNSANWGGGISLNGGRLTIENSTINQNEAITGGGLFESGGLGIESNQLILTDSEVNGNEALSGGGGLSGCNVSIERSTFNNNRAPRGPGGAIYISCRTRTTQKIQDSRFSENSAESGGAIYNNENPLELSGSLIAHNTAEFYGGGLACAVTSLSIVNSVIQNNSAAGSRNYDGGGGIYSFACPIFITNSTIRGNSTAGRGGGAFLDSSASTIQNSIFWANTASGQTDEIYVRDDREVAITYSDVQGGWPGTGNISVHPQFASMFPNIPPGINDYHLHGASPCIDAGHSAGEELELPAVDIDGEVRPLGNAYDMGADEYAGLPPVLPTVDIDANGSDGPLEVRARQQVRVTASVDPGGFRGVAGEWWLLTYAHRQSYLYSLGQFPIREFSNTVLFTVSLDPGVYGAMLILETAPDGVPGVRQFAGLGNDAATPRIFVVSDYVLVEAQP